MAPSNLRDPHADAGTLVSASSSTAAPRSLRKILTPYATPDARRATIQLLNTALPFFALMAVMFCGLDHHVWVALLLCVPAAAFLVRLFAIQHDCGHGSLFKSRWANDLFGRALGVLTLTPYMFWRRDHAMHHANSGNLHRRGVGDVKTLTVREYLSQSAWRRLLYRLYRHPLVLFGLGPSYQFVLRHRIPIGHPLRQRKMWISILGTNAVLAIMVVATILVVGLGPFVLGYFPVIVGAASVGVWLFYVQHQFEKAYWEAEPRWDFHAAALEGSSFYDLPGMLHWVTGNIGFHHIHHLSSKVPNYRLRDCFEQNPELRTANRLSLRASLRCPRLALWDEDARKMVTFAAVRRVRHDARKPGL